MSTPATTRSLARTAAPLITLGATWVARKGMMASYEKGTGRPAPLLHSREATILQKVLWAAAMASVVAIIEVVVWRTIGEED